MAGSQPKAQGLEPKAKEMQMDPRYPIGKFDPQDVSTPLPEVIAHIASLPARLREAVSALEAQGKLDTPYREGGWTARQVVHHLADSHLNAYARFRLTLTEERPAVKGYDEKLWAELPDAKGGPSEASLNMLEGLHARWVLLLRAMKPADFERVFIHSERGEMTLGRTTRLYGWHCRHHLAHLEIVKGKASGASF
jgi:hypothetical protein